MKASDFRKLIDSGDITIEKGKIKGKLDLLEEKPHKSPSTSKKPKSGGRFTAKRHFELKAMQEELIEQLSGRYEIDVTPIPKPRMTKADAWKKRASVTRYFAFKDEIVHKCSLMGLTTIPMRIKYLKFVMPMPPSWSKKDRLAMVGQPHLLRPDIDNLRKALQDALCKEDSHIAVVKEESKVWGTKGKIVIEI